MFTMPPRKKTSAQLDADIEAALATRKAGARKKRKSPREIRAARLETLQGVMADALDDRGWLETTPNELDSWISVDEELTDRAWINAAKDQLIEQSVLPENAGAPPENVRRWNEVFIGTYRMNIDQGMSEEEAIDSARGNAFDTQPLSAKERVQVKDDPKLYQEG
jgi:hypothetical protein